MKGESNKKNYEAEKAVHKVEDILNNWRYLSNRPQVSMVYLTNRFHVAVHLSSKRSQMTSKCGKNKKVAHEAIVRLLDRSITGQIHGNMESICFI